MWVKLFSFGPHSRLMKSLVHLTDVKLKYQVLQKNKVLLYSSYSNLGDYLSIRANSWSLLTNTLTYIMKDVPFSGWQLIVYLLLFPRIQLCRRLCALFLVGWLHVFVGRGQVRRPGQKPLILHWLGLVFSAQNRVASGALTRGLARSKPTVIFATWFTSLGWMLFVFTAALWCFGRIPATPDTPASRQANLTITAQMFLSL